eukprot:CAMPEP_0175441664 /NCGR_PEP_ID=MMETSP0095-20121207/57726_1 /TAXON_ID=311494 /ORGANISM="Alexandrium monilatum, Strain CCMP3105" /LENGTH=70 /DNA_ID=CAMNT_0016741623 /DNA_START=1 /DNA_END=209 /DNA_ORIENTATION=+
MEASSSDALADATGRERPKLVPLHLERPRKRRHRHLMSSATPEHAAKMRRSGTQLPSTPQSLGALARNTP